MERAIRPEPEGSWLKQEWRVIVALVLLAWLCRLPAASHASALLNSDSANGMLMAREVLRGAFPLFSTGQDYAGTLEAYLLAPIERSVPGDPRGTALLQLALLGATIALAYRLLYRVGGRWGAVVAVGWIAVGTPTLHRLTVGAPMSYATNLLLSVLIAELLIAWRGQAPTSPRLFGVGLLVGFAWWNNPQIVYVLAAAVLLLWSMGRLNERVGQRGVRGAIEGRWPALLLWGLLLIAILNLLALTTMLLLHAHPVLTLGGLQLSMKHPDRYLTRALALMASVLVLLEWHAHNGVGRRALLSLAPPMVGGAAIGLAPQLLHHLLGRGTGHSPPNRLYADAIPARLSDFGHKLDQLLLGGAPIGNPAANHMRGLAWLSWALAALLLVGFLWGHRGELAALVTLRARRLSPAMFLFAPLPLCAGLFALRGGATPRYLLPMIICAGAVLAWVIGALSTSRAGRWVAIALVAGMMVRPGLALSEWTTRLRLDPRPAQERQLIAELLAAGATRGYAQYWLAFKLSYVSGERLILASDYDMWRCYLRMPHYYPLVDQAAEPIVIYDLDWDFDRRGRRDLLRRHGGLITGRWRVGRLEALRLRRPPGGVEIGRGEHPRSTWIGRRH